MDRLGPPVGNRMSPGMAAGRRAGTALFARSRRRHPDRPRQGPAPDPAVPLPQRGPLQACVGAGRNGTRFSDVEFEPAVQAAPSPGIVRNRSGPALQAGFDVQLTRDVYLNLDLKKLQIRTDIRSAGTPVGEFRVDPWLFGIGIGQRF
jgi:OmpW family